MVGPRSSGRLAILVSALAAATARGEAVALIDPLDMFDPVSASAAGIDFQRMLWVRGEASSSARVSLSCEYGTLQKSLDRAVKALNIVLQAGGFGVVVLDLAEVAAQTIKRLPYTTWLRLQRVIEGSETACVLIGSEPIARSAGGVERAAGAGDRRRASRSVASDGDRPPCSRAFICRRLLTIAICQRPAIDSGRWTLDDATADRSCRSRAIFRRVSRRMAIARSRSTSAGSAASSASRARLAKSCAARLPTPGCACTLPSQRRRPPPFCSRTRARG